MLVSLRVYLDLVDDEAAIHNEDTFFHDEGVERQPAYDEQSHLGELSGLLNEDAVEQTQRCPETLNCSILVQWQSREREGMLIPAKTSHQTFPPHGRVRSGASASLHIVAIYVDGDVEQAAPRQPEYQVDILTVAVAGFEA